VTIWPPEDPLSRERIVHSLRAAKTAIADVLAGAAGHLLPGTTDEYALSPLDTDDWVVLPHETYATIERIHAQLDRVGDEIAAAGTDWSTVFHPGDVGAAATGSVS